MQAVTNCTTPLTGTLLYIPREIQNVDEGGTLLQPTSVGFNLDNRFPGAEEVSPAGALTGTFFQGAISLRRGEIQTVLFDVVTQRHYCTFTIQLTVDTSRGKVDESITNAGNPFTLTAQSGLADYGALYCNDLHVNRAAYALDAKNDACV